MKRKIYDPKVKKSDNITLPFTQKNTEKTDFK